MRADQIIRVTVLDPEEAELLQTMALSPALLVERTTYDQRGRSVEVAKSPYRGDRYRVRRQCSGLQARGETD